MKLIALFYVTLKKNTDNSLKSCWTPSGVVWMLEADLISYPHIVLRYYEPAWLDSDLKIATNVRKITTQKRPQEVRLTGKRAQIGHYLHKQVLRQALLPSDWAWPPENSSDNFRRSAGERSDRNKRRWICWLVAENQSEDTWWLIGWVLATSRCTQDQQAEN